MDEEWPARPAAHLFYAQEKAEIEKLLTEEAGRRPEPGLYLLRPPIVLGPHAVGAKNVLPGPLEPVGRRVGRSRARAFRFVARAGAAAADAADPRDDVGLGLLLWFLTAARQALQHRHGRV